MATFGQMLAASQAYATPEAQRKLAQTDSLKSEHEVGVQKKSQQQELEALMEEQLAKASGSGGWDMLGNLGKVLSFVPGIGTGVGAGLQALSGAGTAGSQKSKLEKLMKSSKFDKFKNSWLGDPTKAYMKDVKGLAGDIDPLKTGLSSFATSMVTGDIAKGIGEKFKGAFTPSEVGISEQITGQPGGVGIKADFLGGKGGGFDIGKTLDPRFTSGEFIKPGGFDVLDNKLMTQVAPQGLKSLFKDFDIMDIIGGAGEGKGIENLQALPMLMQLFGDSGGGMDFSSGSYFGK
tara:strand:- start:340 stop:1212 length:873 start_codon:yes stop_codon:yes gene_type:complete